jgi:hypothetical protein
MRISLPALATVLLLLGCGNAPPGSASGSGGATPGTTGSSSSTGSPQTTGGGGGGAGAGAGGQGGAGGADACTVKCAAEKQLGCGVGSDCVATCESAFNHPASCGPELAKFYACYAEHAPKEQACTIPNECSIPFGGYLYCTDQLCMSDACDDQQGVCSCSGTCASKNVKSVCTGAECTCSIDGVEVGTCSDGSIPICGLKESCCVVRYFLAK